MQLKLGSTGYAVHTLTEKQLPILPSRYIPRGTRVNVKYLHRISQKKPRLRQRNIATKPDENRRERSRVALFRTFTLQNIWHYDTLGAEGARDVSGLAPCAPSTPHLSNALTTDPLPHRHIRQPPWPKVTASQHKHLHIYNTKLDFPRGQIAIESGVTGSWTVLISPDSNFSLPVFETRKLTL